MVLTALRRIQPPKKPDQIWVVFDSSAEYQRVFLNRELLTGLDFMNSLVGVLFRFRSKDVAAMCDAEEMFHSFHVGPKHRDFLRFLWFKDNNPSQPIIEYRMTVHLFRNGPSPAVATYGLGRTVEDSEECEPGVREQETSMCMTVWSHDRRRQRLSSWLETHKPSLPLQTLGSTKRCRTR